MDRSPRKNVIALVPGGMGKTHVAIGRGPVHLRTKGHDGISNCQANVLKSGR